MVLISCRVVLASCNQLLPMRHSTQKFVYLSIYAICNAFHPDVAGCGTASATTQILRCWSAKYSVTPNALTIFRCQPAFSWRESCYFRIWHSVCKLHLYKLHRLQQTVQRGLTSPPTAFAALEGFDLCVYWILYAKYHAQARCLSQICGNDLSAPAFLRLDLRSRLRMPCSKAMNGPRIGYSYFPTATNQTGERASHQAFGCLQRKLSE